MSCCKLRELFTNKRVGGCTVDKSFEKKRMQYTAIDAHIEHRELPVINLNGFCSDGTETNVCIKEDFTVTATILAIVGTYSNVGNLIFFIEEQDEIFDIIDVIASCRIKYSVGITVSIRRSAVQDGYFVLTIHETHRTLTIPEGQMLSTVNDLASKDKSMLFYMYDNAVGYSNIIHTSNNNIWVSVISNALNMSGMNGSRLMPVFYTEPSEGMVLSINTGIPTVNVNFNIDKIRPQYNSIISGAISSASKDGLCYYCAYLESIHSHLCSKKEVKFEATLLGQFSATLEQ